MNTVVNAFRAHRVTILVWAIILLVIFGLVLHNRHVAQQELAGLSSPNAQIRNAMVRSLVQSGSLVDALTNTEDPNTDATSPQNVLSVHIRENAATSVNALSAAGQITDAEAMDTMFQLAKDSDTPVQTTAQAGLKALGQKNDANLDAIVARLKDGDPTIRSAAVTVLGLVGGVKTANKVDAVINDTAAQTSAIAAMQAIGAPAVNDLAQNLNAPADTVELRLQLIDALGAVGTPNTLAPLKIWASSDQPSLKREAIVSLASIALTDGTTLQTASAALKTATADPKSKPADIQAAKTALTTAQTTFSQVAPLGPILVAALRDTTANSEVRSQSALALGYIGGPEAIKALVTVLSDYDTQVRQAAVAGLQSAGPLAVAPLIAALSEGDLQARAGAAEALGGIGNPTAIAALNATFAASGTSALVRRSAALGLGRSGSPAVIPTLVRALGDPNGDVQAAASDALLSPALSASAVAPLIASFTRPTPVPFNASQTLSRMGSQAVPQLEAAVRTADSQTQTWAAVTLGQTDSKDPGIQSALKPLLASANPEVKFAASQAVSRLSGS